METKLALEGFATKEIALTQKPIKEIIKESEGVIIVYDKPAVKKKLNDLVKKHSKEIAELIALEVLTVKQETRLTELRKFFKDSRIALNNITKHNISVLAQASKTSKEVKDELILIVEPIEEKISFRLQQEDQRREKAAEEKERKEIERVTNIEEYIQSRKEDFQGIIDKTKTFESIEPNKKVYIALVAAVREVLNKKEFDLMEFEEDYEEMLKGQSEAFQNKIDKLTEAKNLQDREEKLAITELTNERKGELLDFGLNYKGEATLGELSLEEYAEIMVPAKVRFRTKQLEELGFIESVTVGDIWIYSPNENLILQTVNYPTIKMLSNEVWEALLVEAKQMIEDYNNPKEETPEAEASEEVIVTTEEAEKVAEAEEQQPAETDEEGAVISLMNNANSIAPFVGYLSIVDFPERNVEIAKDQPQYQTLPAYVDSQEGTITSCWELTKEQIEEVNRTGKIWLRVLTFGKPLQPVLLSVLKEDFIK